MSNPFTPGVGRVPSADIAVPEHEREVRFYSRVLTTGEKPLWREDLMNDLGMPIIGLGARIPEYASLPLQWMPHIQVADVATSCERALALGGTELMHGKGDDGESQWAVLLDPNGAAFGIIPVVAAEAGDESGGDAPPEARARCGRISWLDLTVAEAAVTCEFYRQVVGWTARNVAMEDAGKGYSDHDMLDASETPVARIRHARGANAGLPPVWMIHLPVGDLEESLGRVREGGGEVLHATRRNDGSYDRAVIEDPVGARFALEAG